MPPIRRHTVKSIFIDWDGTLAFTAVANGKAYSDAIEAVLKQNISVQAPIDKGQHWSEFLPWALGPKYSSEIGREISRVKSLIYPKFFNLITFNHNLIDVINDFSGSVYVVTNASQNVINNILDNHNVTLNIKEIISPTKQLRAKPFPDLYLFGLKKAAVNRSYTLAIDDSDNGRRAAIAAQIPTLHPEAVCFGLN